MDLKYGGAYGSILANKTTPTHLVYTKYPTRVALEDETKVISSCNFKNLQSFCKSKMRSLKLDYVVALNKLLGMNYNMEDKKEIIEEAQVELA
jgi:hypothetical protein